MDIKIERRLRQRAVDLGNSGDSASLNELIQLTSVPVANVRRLAVSALSKLAGIVDAKRAVEALLPLLKDKKPQVRQYTIKALKSYGTNSKCSLADLKDISNNPYEKEYNRQDAELAVELIEEAIRIEEERATYLCQRCGKLIDSGEYARSQKAFQRNYCDHCFDEVFVNRRNWQTKVELNKNITTHDGTFVQSKGEMLISNWLNTNQITYRYDEGFRILEGYSIRPDFYLPEFDVYIEYWGMDTNDYKIGMLRKQNLYQQQGKKLVSIYPKDIGILDYVMRSKLSKYLRL